jgi:hypothetical protein
MAEKASLIRSDASCSGDELPQKCAVIEVHVPELKRLFNAIDPSPFRERDLDPKAEEFIVGWAKDLPTDAQLAFVVHLDRPAGMPDEGFTLRDAIHEYFRRQAERTRQRLRDLLRRGRTSLAIGIFFLAGLILIGNTLSRRLQPGIADIVRESLLIGGWVAMWRPLEVFLYDWWPVRNEARIYDRLATMPVQIKYKQDAPVPREAWRSDWPAAPLAEERAARPN